MFSLKQIWQFSRETLCSFVDHSIQTNDLDDLRVGTTFVLATPGYMSHIEIQIVEHCEFLSTFKNYDFETAYSLIMNDIKLYPGFKSVDTKEKKHFTERLKPIKKYISRYHVLKKLGDGYFGRAYLCIDIDTFERFVIKEIDSSEDRNTNWQSEIDCLKKLTGSGFTPDYIEDIKIDNLIYIVIKYIPNTTTLEKYIDRHIKGDCSIRTDLKKTETLVGQILSFYEKLLKLKVFHNDICPSNILICEKTSKLYLIDFGLSTSSDHLKSPTARRINYTPPSYLGIYNKSVEDAMTIEDYSNCEKYAIGCTVIALLTGKDPFDGYKFDIELESRTCANCSFDNYVFNDKNNQHAVNAINMIKLINKECGSSYCLNEIMHTPVYKRESKCVIK